MASQKDIAAQIKAACARFSSEWRTGKKPQIETYLKSVDRGSRVRLLGSLLQVELRLLEQAGQTPSLETYRKRFPKHGKIVAAAYRSATGKPATEPQPTRDKADQTTSRKLGPEAPQGGGQPAAPPDSAADDSLTPTGTYAGAMAQLENLGRFQVADMLGQGGFGTVYRAHDPKLRRNVAIKIPRDDSLDPKEVERFLQEARAAAAVSHPNICPIYEINEVQGRPYIVMAYVEGKPLSELLKSKPKMSPRQAATIVAKIATAMAKAHEKGIVHRDLKPANVMIETSGRPVVMDFGLARQPRAEDAEQTQTGVVKGTPAYMSPEQARGEVSAFGPGMDIYSLGVMLYELLAGRRPFGGSVNEIIGKIQFVEPEPPSAHRKKLDPALESICMKAMAKGIEERYASMRAFADALKQHLRQSKQAAAGRSTAETSETSEEGNVTKHLAAMVKAAMGESVAVRSVQRANRNVLWISLASIIAIGLVALAAILMLGRPKTTLVVLNIDVDVTDESLEFVLDGEQIAGKSLQAPVALTVGDHKLIVKRNGEIIRRYAFTVSGDETQPLVLKDETKPPRPEAPPFAIAPFTAEQARQHQEAWAKYLGVPVEYENSLSMKFMLIPPGEFMMGSTEEEIAEGLAGTTNSRLTEWLRSEGPQHRVRIAKPFYLGAHEVTVGQFRAFVETSGYKTQAETDGKGGAPAGVAKAWQSRRPEYNWRTPSFDQTDEHPAVQLTWNDGTAFCDWLTDKEGVRYTLPTEAQWEYACRAGTTTEYWVGEDPEQQRDIGNVTDTSFNEQFSFQGNAVDFDDGHVFTAPVMTYRANPFGIYDMCGNVWEWCSDWWAADSYPTSKLSDPVGPPSGEERVFRGGSFRKCIFRAYSSSNRSSRTPDFCFADAGFRVVLAIDSVKREGESKPAKPETPPLAVAPFTPKQARQHQEAWAKYLEMPVEHENSIGMKLMLIPPGEFMMGGTEEEIVELGRERRQRVARQRRENHQHKVRITQPFYVGAHEVTVGQFRNFVNATRYRTDAEAQGTGGDVAQVEGKWVTRRWQPGCDWKSPGFEQSDNHPVINVSWNDSVAFCKWLSEQEGKRYSLPTEAEWEYTCRSGGTGRWWFGDDEAQLDRYAWHSQNGGVGTKVVGQKESNAFGVFDIHGNVWEWCSDWFGDDYYLQSPLVNPPGPSTGDQRVFRGGCWPLSAWHLRAALRHRNVPTVQNCDLGFRVTLRIDPAGQDTTSSPPPPQKPETATEEEPALAPLPGIIPQPAKIPGTGRWQLESVACRGAVTALAWSPDGKYLAACGQTSAVKVFDAQEMRLFKVLIGHGAKVNGLGWNVEGTLLATGGEDGTLQTWAMTDESVPVFQLQHEGPVRAIAWKPDGERLACGRDDGSVRVWSTDGEVAWETKPSPRAVRALAWSPDGKSLATGGSDGTVRIRKIGAEDFIELRAHQAEVTSVAWSPKGDLLATAGADKKILLWLPDGTPSSVLTGHPHDVSSLAWHPDARRLAAGDRGNGLRIWDVESQTSVSIEGHTRAVLAVAWSPDGKELVSSGVGANLRFWSPEGKPLRVLMGHPDNGGLTSHPERFSLPGGQTVKLSDTGEVLEGSAALFDEHFVYLVEQPDGSTKLYEPPQFRRHFAPDQGGPDVSMTPDPAASSPSLEQASGGLAAEPGRAASQGPSMDSTATEPPAPEVPQEIWQGLRPLLTDRCYEEADQLLEKALADATAESGKEALERLRRDVEHLQRLLSAATEQLEKLKPGNEILVRGMTRRFVSYDRQAKELLTQLGVSKKTTPLADLRVNDLVQLASISLGTTSAQVRRAEAVLYLVDSHGDAKKAVRLLQALAADGQNVEQWLRIADQWGH